MRVRLIVTTCVVLAVGLAIGAYVVLPGLQPDLPVRPSKACEARTATGSVALDADQMANAATIAAVGVRRGLPDRAVVIALATALQESKLRNLPHGDRDSLGLFQQRPSQGWGSPEQIADPRYAAGRFYSALVRVRGWESMRLTDAAQRVQRSAFPEAYEKWSDESIVLAEAMIGRASRAVVCTSDDTPAQRGAPAAEALGAGLRLDWGDVTTITDSAVLGLVVSADADSVGWRYAHWLVAHSKERGVARVRFGDQQWTAHSGAWSQVERIDITPGLRVVAEVYAGG